jgi:hypothetical protein
MDAKARRLLWNDITSLIKENRIVILTSHSMEECEALCTRLVIMVNGQFKCIGSPQHLKTKFGSGFLLTVRLNNEEYKNLLLNFMRKNFPESTLQDSHKNLFEFVLPFASTKLSSIFNKLERNRAVLDLKDYSISQTTLDQIFINFAKQQREDPFVATGELKKSQDQLNVELGSMGGREGGGAMGSNVSQVNYMRSTSLDYEALNQQSSASRRGSHSSVASDNGVVVQAGAGVSSIFSNPSGLVAVTSDERGIKSSSRRGSQASLGSLQLKKNNKVADLNARDSNNNNLPLGGGSRRSSLEMSRPVDMNRPDVFILPLSGDMKKSSNDDLRPLGLFVDFFIKW